MQKQSSDVGVNFKWNCKNRSSGLGLELVVLVCLASCQNRNACVEFVGLPFQATHLIITFNKLYYLTVTAFVITKPISQPCRLMVWNGVYNTIDLFIDLLICGASVRDNTGGLLRKLANTSCNLAQKELKCVRLYENAQQMYV